MHDLFLYNWQVREEWFNWCDSLSEEELRAERVGGMGSILRNLVHVIQCELIWINKMLEEPIDYPEKDSISSLEDAIKFSKSTRAVTENFLRHAPDFEKNIKINSKNGNIYIFSFSKILRHIITHEIHHIGQLSIWAREMGLKPVSSDLIIRKYEDTK